MADVIAVTYVSQLQPAQPAKALLECEEIRQSLARMEPVGERVDHGDGSAGGQLVEYALLVGAHDDAVHPALQVPGYVSDRLPRAQRGLLENQRQEAAAERAAITVGPRLDVGRKMIELAHHRGAPFGAGQ